MPHNGGHGVTLLMADDDAEDRMMAQEAMQEARVVNDLRFVEDGAELMDYLRRRGCYADACNAPRPSLLLLDLNMPRKDGREVLAEMKADADLRMIPVVVLTTSKAEEDICRAYDLGVNSYITKPVTFKGLVEVMQTLGRYWLQIVELPHAANGERHEGLPRQSAAGR